MTSADASEPDLPASLRPLACRLNRPELLEPLVASRPGRGGREAAVLILLADQGDGPELVFIEKTSHLRKHAGQIAFPGGAIEPSDPHPIAGALREAEEEAGIDPESVLVLGTLPSAHIQASGFDVVTVVGYWREPVELLPVDTHEVASVYQIAVADLTRPSDRWMAIHPSGYRGPAFRVGDLFIWGFTAHLVDGLLSLAGWEEPWDTTREARIPKRFLRGG